jgi:flagellar protein FlaJ
MEWCQRGKSMAKEKQTTKPLVQGKKNKSLMSSLLKTKKRKTTFMSVMGGLVIIIITLVISSSTGNAVIRDLGFVMGIITVIVPVAMIDLKTSRKRDNIVRNLPIFLLAVGSSVKSGMSLLRAIEDAADRNMGSLSPELKNLRATISWGMPVKEAFEQFANRTNTKLSRRVILLLELSMEIGGDITETLDVIQRHVTEMANLEKERKSSLQPYIFTIYISFGVFMAIAAILVSQFFTQIEQIQAGLIETMKTTHTQTGSFSAIVNVNVNDLKKTMFHMSLVEAIFGGLAAGKIGEGSFVGGVKHIVILVIIAVVTFGVIGGL